VLEVMLVAALCLADGPEAPSLPDAPPPRPPTLGGPKGPVAPAAPAVKPSALPAKAPAVPAVEAKPEPKVKPDKKKDHNIPPSLTTSALRNEVRGQPAEERGGSERARLEQLAADIARAREALRQDTARLEALLKNGGSGEGRFTPGEGDGATPTPISLGSREMLKEQIDTVSRAMKGMKPEQAAPIVARLDRTLAAEILRRMRPADAGAVMGQLKPEVAADLATIIATKRPITSEPSKEAKR
jgi:flagellar motility protein MotE (MotC chaperone)